MPKLPIINSLKNRWKHSIPPDALKAGPVLNMREGEHAVVLYTSATDKMKNFSAFIREGLENGDKVNYAYNNDEEKETVMVKLKENGVDTEKYEKDGALNLGSLTELYMPNGKLDCDKAINVVLNMWTEAKKRGYKHVRTIEDLGDFSFINGQWQRFITECWLDPRWDDPNVSDWAESKAPVGVVYDPFLMEVTAINVEYMMETQVAEILKAMGRGSLVPAKLIDLIEDVNYFSRSIGLTHEQMIGRKILLEFDPASDYEKVVNSLAKESMANVEPPLRFYV